jgi:hypothetical protein
MDRLVQDRHSLAPALEAAARVYDSTESQVKFGVS